MLGDRLGKLRRGKGLTQRQLADLLFVSVNTISAYERNINTPDDPTKIWLAKFFDVSMDYLMGLSDKPDCSSPLLLYVCLLYTSTVLPVRAVSAPSPPAVCEDY